jgi:hypothetical protein
MGLEWPSSGDGVGRSPKSGDRDDNDGMVEAGENSVMRRCFRKSASF